MSEYTDTAHPTGYPSGVDVAVGTARSDQERVALGATQRERGWPPELRSSIWEQPPVDRIVRSYRVKYGPKSELTVNKLIPLLGHPYGSIETPKKMYTL